jgi:thiol-disulfide isomerase/thioredoxin
MSNSKCQLLVVGLFCISYAMRLHAEDKPKVDSEKSQVEEKKAESNEKKEEVDRYAIPENATSQQLMKFITDLREFVPQTPADALEHRKKASIGIREAAEAILTTEKNEKSAEYVMASTIVLAADMRKLYLKSKEERLEFVSKIRKLLTLQTPPQRDQLVLGMQTASMLERTEGEEQNAKQMYLELGELLAKSDDPRIAAQAKRMEGSARRLDLVGKPLELEGKTFTGEDFNLKSLKGKVVLIDFWATWCGPCIAEIPNMKAMYEAYHESGFEIVGLSSDDDREALNDFLENRKLPWIILHDEANQGNHAAMTYYGISGIPTMILVGKDGNVLDIHARGEQLEALLVKEFGERKKASKEKEKPEININTLEK